MRDAQDLRRHAAHLLELAADARSRGAHGQAERLAVRAADYAERATAAENQKEQDKS